MLLLSTSGEWQLLLTFSAAWVCDQTALPEQTLCAASQAALEADVDKSGTLTWDEFKDHLQDPAVMAYFQALAHMQSEEIGSATHENHVRSHGA